MNNNTQHTNLRITKSEVEPSIKSSLEIPQVLCYDEIERQGDWILIQQPKSLADVKDVPELAHSPKFWKIDVKDQEALLRFSASMGHHLVPVDRLRWRDVMDAPKGPNQQNMDDKYADMVNYWSTLLGWEEVHQEHLFDTSRKDSRDPVRIHLAEIAARIWMMQSVLSVLVDIDLPSESHNEIPEFPADAVPTTPSLVAVRFNRFLTPFSPSVHVMTTKHLREPESWGSFGALQATALEITALMIYNGIVKDLKWHTCLKCSAPFQFQVGRTDRSISNRPARIDAKFCTDRCASAYTQKAYRERQKSEKKGNPSNVETRK